MGCDPIEGTRLACATPTTQRFGVPSSSLSSSLRQTHYSLPAVTATHSPQAATSITSTLVLTTLIHFPKPPCACFCICPLTSVSSPPLNPPPPPILNGCTNAPAPVPVLFSQESQGHATHPHDSLNLTPACPNNSDGSQSKAKKSPPIRVSGHRP